VEFTGERFVPTNELVTDEIGIEHLHRYHTIAEFVKNKEVLDIACGEGYGSAILAKNALTVCGVDIDAASVAYASQTYSTIATNLKFLTGSVAHIPLPDNSIDVIVSFETIEHVDENTQHAFLVEVKRVLRPGGSFIISTPDRINYSERYNYKNAFHLKEFSQPEFQQFLSGYFVHIETFFQGFDIVSTITPSQSRYFETIKVCDWETTPSNPSKKYLIALCSDAEFGEKDQISSVVFNTAKDFLEITDRILEKEAHILELGAWGKSLDKEIEVKNNLLLNQREESLTQKAQLLDQREELFAKDKQLQALMAEINRKDQELEERNAFLLRQEEAFGVLRAENILQQERIRALEVKVQTTTEESTLLKQEVQDSKDIIQGQKQQLHSLYNQIDALNGRLNEIYISEGWKLLSIYYGIKGRVLREDTKRYRIAKKIVNQLRGKKEELMGAVALPSSSKPNQGQAIISKDIISYEAFTLPKYANPLVSIIIPAYNAWEMNYTCIKAIKENSLGVSYEVILGDDCSTDETKDIGSYIENIVAVRNEKNLGFLQNCNHAATFSKGKYLVFLNNDTEVRAGWLTALTELLEKDSSIGMVGSKLIYPDGRLQEAGGIIWNDASGWNYGHKQDPEAPEFNYVKEVDYISGASIMIRKDLWSEIGGFDTLYSPAYFEDTDIAFEIRKRGYKVVYQPQSEVIHYEGYSHGTEVNGQIESNSIKLYQQINKDKFFKKWGTTLQEEHFPNAENVFWARDKSQSKKTILVIDHYVPHFDKDAGSKNTFQYLELFISLGFNVKFIGDNFFKHEPYTTALQQRGIEVLYGNYYQKHWPAWVKENADKIDYVYLNRPHISIKYIDFIKQNTKAKILYFGHDLHFFRELKQYEVEKRKELLVSAEKWKQTELYLFGQSDVILTPSEEEKRIIQGMAPGKKVESIRLFFYKELNEPILSFSDRENILFVGGFNHKPNVDGILWFVQEVWPKVKLELPSVKFIIVGSNAPKEIEELARPDILVKGFVSDEELERLYHTTKMIVIPLRYGAGVKGKVVEAMYHGVPMVTTPDGIEGLPGDISFLSPANNAKDFAHQVVDFYDNENLLVQQSKQAVAYMNTNFHLEVAQGIFQEIVEDL
jgi:O-antigen biosynthesis protein